MTLDDSARQSRERGTEARSLAVSTHLWRGKFLLGVCHPRRLQIPEVGICIFRFFSLVPKCLFSISMIAFP
jgi:hypothetical protein